MSFNLCVSLLKSVLKELLPFFESQLLLKYNSNGNLEWEKETFLGPNSNNVRPRDIIEAANGQIISVGQIQGKGYFYRMSIQGDSLGLALNDSSEIYSRIVELNSSDHFVRSSPHFLRLNNEGTISSSYNIAWGGGGGIQNDGFIATTEYLYTGIGVGSPSFTDSTHYFKYDIETGQLTEQNSYEDIGPMMTLSPLGNIAGYREGLIIMNQSLEKLHSISYDEITIVDSWVMEPSNIVPVSDGGFLLMGTTGSQNSFPYWYAYLIKISSEAEREWGYAYSNLPVVCIYDAVEVNDGYVLLGGNGLTEKIWLMKILKDGMASSTSETPTSPHHYIVFPNPFTDFITLNMQNPIDGTINMFNISGKMILNQPTRQEVTLDLSHLSPGLYMLQVTNSTNQIISAQKIIKH